MTQNVKETIFTLNEELCTGCGKCIKACLPKVLKIVDGLCTMTESFKCLLCGECRQACPENAITVELADSEGRPGTQERTQKENIESLLFRPILEDLTKIMLQELGSVQVYDFEGKDIKELDNFEIEGQPCYDRLYRTDKIEKASVSSSNFYGLTCSKAICLTPSVEYDFPSFVMDWTEAEDAVFILCDLIPGDDPGRNKDYLTKYLYNHFDELYLKYKDIPGLEPISFHWVRAHQSPYMITGNVDKDPGRNVDMIHECVIRYFKAWIEIWREAKPLDPDSAYMKLVNERRKVIRDTYLENDPAAGILNKFLGDESAHTILKLIMP